MSCSFYLIYNQYFVLFVVVMWQNVENLKGHEDFCNGIYVNLWVVMKAKLNKN